MKKVILTTLLLLTVSQSAFAWISTEVATKDYNFVYRFNKETYKVELKGPSYDEAFEKAAQNCFDHFKGGRRISEDFGIAVIDVCANPRSI